MKGIDLAAPFRQLVERRLWPLAVLLLVAAAAVPVLLAGGGEVPAPSSSAPAAQAPTANASTLAPLVSVSDAQAVEDRRKVLGARKDPFRPAPAPKVKSPAGHHAAAPAATSQSAHTAERSAPAGGGGAAPAPASAPAPAPVTAPTMPAAPKTKYELYSLTVRFGDSTNTHLPKSNLKRLKALPSAADPAVIYLGMLADRKTAVFLVDSRVSVVGDGKCLPSPTSCHTLHLRVGETAFLDMAGEGGATARQFQLDVVKVARRITTDAAAARRARLAEAQGGRTALKARISRVGRLRYDAKTGTLRRTRNG